MKYWIVTLLIGTILLATDFNYNTGGYVGYVPELAGSATGWGEWFITSFTNVTGTPLKIVEFGFPCCGVPTGSFGWIIWTDMPDTGPPIVSPENCNFHGSFTPVEGPGGDSTVYTYVDIASVADVIFNPGETIVFGYQNTGYGGQTPFNGTDTWSWHHNNWESDASHYRTAVLEMKANIWSALEQTTWGELKTVF